MRRHHSRPRNRWLDLVWKDFNPSSADLLKKVTFLVMVQKWHYGPHQLHGHDDDDDDDDEWWFLQALCGPPWCLCDMGMLFTLPVTGSDVSQRLLAKSERLAALCETSKQLQSRLRSETRRLQSDFTDQGFNGLFRWTLCVKEGVCVCLTVKQSFFTRSVTVHLECYTVCPKWF